MTDQVQKSNRKRKIRALLAGGLVLGVGAAITLAAWTDNVFGNSDFATGDAAWNLQGNFSTGTPAWTPEYNVSPGGAIQFPVPLKDNLSPGDVVRAPLGLRLEPGQTLGASITLTGPTIAPTNVLANALTYGIYTGVTAADCVSGNIGTSTVVPAGSPLSTGTATPITISSGTDAQNGTPVELCFVVTLPANTPNTASGLQTGQLVWDFAGTSIA
ncbi:MAG: SipW-dependent-type signal peptide-containing protein [Rhodococcus sp. (in: high G+C Gram-positive bacteria)]|jgi:predicted ribosomally synthesized peptide with SipW-like signal peptide|uniref:SipW-dependent-type signal peptide-containing protein n=1 Tax=Rhodococcus sp. EPR-157 TaxID=1813677 RepID=UPI0007BB0A48|nr:SipW-dependent-type signal peptide-containing protein [Rhodococcus sp. EPR-157]KZF08188.1 hypothetical protein A2J03_21630 [Rhodococcus sp. EPR-157]